MWFDDRLQHDTMPPVLICTEKTDNFGRWLGTIYTHEVEDDLTTALIEAGLTTGRYE